METPIGTYPQKSFVDVSDGRQGLIIANRGLPEYEALAADDGTVTIALTLLRCVGWLSRGDFATRRGPAGPSLEAPGAQMQGRWTFHYSLIPHSGAVPAGRQGWQAAFQEAHRFARPLSAVRSRGGSGSLPASASLLEVEPPFVLSALKTADGGDGVVARVYNTADAPVKGRLRLLSPHAGAEAVDLNEEPLGSVDTDGDRVVLSARPNQILSVKFRTT
jgi:alpha-mannosidase